MNLVLLCLSLIVGQTQPASEKPEVRLDIMKKAMARVQLQDAETGRDAYRLRAGPILRFTNTVGDTRDGAIFLWLGEGDRPGAAVQVFLKRNGDWIQEWTSLATGPLIAKEDGPAAWRPSRGGVEFRPIPDVPRPAATPELRLRQMHDLTREFTARDFFHGRSWQPLRMLSKPFARYGKPGSGVIDGALFAYVLTTDPEVYLMIEARMGRDGPEWQYAFAPMSIFPLECSWRKRVVCELHSWPGRDPSGTFYLRGFQPGE